LAHEPIPKETKPHRAATLWGFLVPQEQKEKGTMRKIITAITTAVVINKMVNFMTKNEPGVELNIGFRIFRIAVWITATTGCLALMAWLVAFAWAEIRSLI
jgi:hypothetical protein